MIFNIRASPSPRPSPIKGEGGRTSPHPCKGEWMLGRGKTSPLSPPWERARVRGNRGQRGEDCVYSGLTRKSRSVLRLAL